MQGKVGIGVIGCGVIAKGAHLNNYKENSNVHIVAVADIKENRAREAAEKFGAEAYYTDYKELLKRPDIDAVSICTPHPTHAPIAVDAALAGKHILCEKPMAVSVKQADEMIETAKKMNVKLMAGYQIRFSPVLIKVKKLIDEGAIGKIYQISKVKGNYQNGNGDADWFYTKEAGGGVMLDWTTYTAFMFSWFLGNVKSVYALTDTFIKERISVDVPNGMVKMEVEDTTSMLMRFENGAMGIMYDSWSSPTGHDHTEIVGSDGYIELRSDSKFPIAVYTKKKEYDTPLGGWSYVEVPGMGKFNAYKSRIDHFVECILEDKEPIVTGEDGKKAVGIIEAAYRSAKSGKSVDLPFND